MKFAAHSFPSGFALPGFRRAAFAALTTLVTSMTAAFLVAHQSPLYAQQPPPQRPGLSGNRAFNPYAVEFQPAWNAVISDPVKLIEIGPVVEEKKNNLLLLVGGTEQTDYKRHLIISHWNGSRFITDTTSDFLGTAQDALLAGHFRVTPKPVTTTASPAPKGKKPKSQPSSQIITTEGVYLWNGDSFSRLYASPPNLRLALVLDGTPDQLVINSGTSATPYEAGETDAHPSAFLLDTTQAGYVRMAVGTQNFDGSKDFMPNVRFAQSFWQGRNHWQIGLARGKSAPTPTDPDATTGDSIVVFTPKLINKDKPFWKLTRSDDFEESWRSAPLPGHVLDVRVGDPKNEGHDGILVLTSETNAKDRHLYFFLPSTGRIPR